MSSSTPESVAAAAPSYWFELRVRYADTDAQGHVYFANYLTFCDEAMTGYLHHIGYSPQQMASADVDVVYADARCRYLGRCRFQDVLRIGVTTKHVGRTSFVTTYTVMNGKALVAQAELVNVCVSASAMTKVEVPPLLRAALTSKRAAAATVG